MLNSENKHLEFIKMPLNTITENSKITVLMSVYNGEGYLRESVESILTQTYKDFEFIIVNDASKDKSLTILEEYERKDKRIILVSNNENSGLTKSLNNGLKMAKGKYIARQDADDISEPERLFQQVTFLEKHPDIGLIGSDSIAIDDRGKQIGLWETLGDNDQIKERLKKTNCFCHGSVMLRSECLKSVGVYREKFRYAQDFDLWLRISERFKVMNINTALYRLRKNPKSISGSNLSTQLDYQLLAIELAKERQGTGRDSLETIKTDNIEQILCEK